MTVRTQTLTAFGCALLGVLTVGYALQASDAVGRRNGKWDEAARRGLDLAAQVYGVDPQRPGDVLERIPALFGAAIAAGGDDPLVAYIHARIVDSTDREAAAVEELRMASTRLEQSQFPAFRRALALVYTADTMANLARVKVLPEVLRDRTRPDRQLKQSAAASADPR
jgi:hypothetical protein